MRSHLLIACFVAACASPAPKSVAVAPSDSHLQPFDGPFETDRREAERIYEVVLTYHADSVLTKFEVGARRRGQIGETDSLSDRLDARIGRYRPGAFVTTGERHDTTWLRSMVGRHRIVELCPKGLLRRCRHGGLVLSPIRRPDSLTAQVELARYYPIGERWGEQGNLFTLQKRNGTWHVTARQFLWTT